jgi:hypothetical protein
MKKSIRRRMDMKKLSPSEPRIRVSMFIEVNMDVPLTKIAKRLSVLPYLKITLKPPNQIQAVAHLFSKNMDIDVFSGSLFNVLKEVSGSLRDVCFKVEVIFHQRIDPSYLSPYCALMRYKNRVIGICNIKSHSLRLYYNERR